MSPRTNAAVRPLLAWRAEQLCEVASVFQRACSSWGEAWGLVPLPMAICRRPLKVDLDKHWTGVGADVPGDAWLHCPAEVTQAVGHALFDVETRSPLATEVIGKCIADFRAHLGRVLGRRDLHEESPQGAALETWSGWVCVELPFGAMVLLDGTSARSLIAPRVPVHAPLHALSGALQQHALNLQVRLQACELELGSLRDLQPGDVLRFTHAVNDPAAVVDADGNVLFQALLVRKGGRKAVELVAAAERVNVEELA